MISSVKYHRNATNILINQKQDKNHFLRMLFTQGLGCQIRIVIKFFKNSLPFLILNLR